ncbi:MAG TPA: NAD(P)/FAD-dependent oxidoreductase [Nitrolancea sp.]|nr:NAD(P)/FAD-dependent oxidoreductase [Nitrolancea sp.]
MEWQSPDEPRRTRVLIIGGGFAGVYTAFALQKELDDEPVDVAIVNRENFFVFYPLMSDIISGAIETSSILNPIRLVASNATLYVGEVSSINLDQQRVDVRLGLYGSYHEPRPLYYDHLVIALGGVPNTRVVPGMAENAFDVQRLSNAFALRNHLIDTLEQADIETDPVEKRRLLTFVVVGGGTNGVEVVGEIHDMLVEVTDLYKHIEREDIRVVLIHGGPRLIPDLPQSLGEYAEQLLRKKGVEIMLNTRVPRVEPNRVFLDNGDPIDTSTIVGSIGVSPNPLVTGLPLEQNKKGQIKANRTLNVPGHPNIWALGDAAEVLDEHTGKPYPQTAQHAVREARTVARNIVATIRGEPLKPITYRTRGQLVALGHRSAVAYIMGLKLSGFPAWWIWRSYYLLQIPRWDKRLRVMFDWTLDLLFPPELTQLKVGQPTPSIRPAPKPEPEKATAG